MEENFVVGVDFLEVVVVWVVLLLEPLQLVDDPILRGLEGIVPPFVSELLDLDHS